MWVSRFVYQITNVTDEVPSLWGTSGVNMNEIERDANPYMNPNTNTYTLSWTFLIVIVIYSFN